MLRSHIHTRTDSVPMLNCSFLPGRAPVARSFPYGNSPEGSNWTFAGSGATQKSSSAYYFFRNLMVEIPLKIGDAIAHRARSHKEIQPFLEDQHTGPSAGDLVGQVLAERSLGRDWIVGFADAREKQEPHTVGSPCREHHHLSGLHGLLTVLVHVD